MSIATTFDAPTVQVATGRASLITGRIVTAVAALFLAFDASMKVMQVPAAVEGTKQLGFPVGIILPLGIIQVIALVLYLVPRTSVFGAIVWTGYLGGAVATHVRLGNPLFTHVLSPVYVALFLWGGLWLRQAGVRAVLPLRRG